MPYGNRTVKSLARQMQHDQGIPYMESLKQAQREVHIDPDILDDQGWNGSLRAHIAESWLPVVTRLVPPSGCQWVIGNYGPGHNFFAPVYDHEDWMTSHFIHVSTKQDAAGEEAVPVEELCPPDVLEMPNVTVGEALSVHIITSSSPEFGLFDQESVEHLDLRDIHDEKQRVERISDFINDYTRRYPAPALDNS